MKALYSFQVKTKKMQSSTRRVSYVSRCISPVTLPGLVLSVPGSSLFEKSAKS